MRFNFFKKNTLQEDENALDEVDKMLDQYDWIKAGDVLFRYLTRLDKKGEESPMIKWWLRSSELDKQKNNGIQLAVRVIQDKIAEVYAVKIGSEEYKKIIQAHIEEERVVGVYTNEKGENIELKMTPGQLMKRWMEIQDETLLPTFRKTMHYSDKIINKIENTLTDQEKKIAEWMLSEFFPTYIEKGYDGVSLNKVYADIYNLDLTSVAGIIWSSDSLADLKYSYIEVMDGKEEWVEGEVDDEELEDIDADKESAEEKIEDASFAIEETRDKVDDIFRYIPEAEKYLGEAKDKLKEARRMWDRGNWEEAHKFARKAQDLAFEVEDNIADEDEPDHEEWEENYWDSGFGEEEEKIEEDDLEYDVLLKLIRSFERLSFPTKRTIKSPIKDLCIYESLYKFIFQLEYFKAFASFYREIHAVYSSQKVRTAILQYHGERPIQLLDDLLDYVKRGYLGESRLFDVSLFTEDFNDFKRNRIYPPKEIKEAMNILDGMEEEFDNSGFRLVKRQIKKAVRVAPDAVMQNMKYLKSSREWVYSWVVNIAGDLVESGQYHLYRGIINPMGPGENLLKLYDDVMDKLVEMGVIETDRAKKEKETIRENIKTVG